MAVRERALARLIFKTPPRHSGQTRGAEYALWGEGRSTTVELSNAHQNRGPKEAAADELWAAGGSRVATAVATGDAPPLSAAQFHGAASKTWGGVAAHQADKLPLHAPH